jgi:ActR/RegA family two-component response regulator
MTTSGKSKRSEIHGPRRSRPGETFAYRQVMIVEDDYLAAVELARAVQDFGMDSRMVGRVDAARALARDWSPELAFVDINLAGGFEGLDLARELEALYACRVIYVTAYHVRDLAARMRGGAPANILFKPVERGALEAALIAAAGTQDRLN